MQNIVWMLVYTQLKYSSEIRMKRIIHDLFFAGTDTTSLGLSWSLLYLVAHPHVQEKCQQEIDTVGVID